MSEFVHLHNHSDYSLLDGAVSVKKMVARAKELGMKSVALTDHGNMFGAIKFYNACKAEEVKPIIGSEAYVAPGSRFTKKEEPGVRKNYHLVLLARNQQGYRNLMKLISMGYTDGFYYKPRVDDEILAQYSEGITALSACLAGSVPQAILNGQMEEATRKALFYQEIFGKGNYYLEMQDHGIPEQKTVNKGVYEISRKTGIPLVATNDVHFLNREDAMAQDILICIGTNKKLDDKNRLKFDLPEFYFKSYEEMAALFKDVPEALSNTLKIDETMELEIPLPGPILPDYAIPEGDTQETYFRKITQEGLKQRYHTITPELQERLDYEIGIITQMGFIGYFLIVWDFIKYAKDHDIPVGPGRGSGAGSIVAYSMQITDIDPMKYSLLFERFLNPERVSMPDFDVDFCYERRQEVIDYVNRKYGVEKVGQIITFGTLKSKAVIRDVARVLDFPYAEADRISKLVPAGPKVTLDKALEMEPELRDVANMDSRHKLLIDTSKKLEGLNRHASTHAAGVVIGQKELTYYVPLYKDSKTGAISTQYTMDNLEDAGLVKMDFLGLKTLTLIKNTLKLITRKGIHLNIGTIPENDAPTFELLGEGKSTCIFQFESSGMQNILKRAKPEKIEDLIALNALYRPGPMENIDQFIASKFDPNKIEYPHPDLEEVLKETYGVIVYQEQVMQIAQIIAGYSLGGADILRRAMGKKKVEVMDKEKIKFVEGAVKKGYSKEKATFIFDLLVPFAGYGFNKSHAAAYSVLAYQTAYLKANFPAEFMAANLTNEINNTDKLTEYINESSAMGIKIRPPDINDSEIDFTVVEGAIIYGMEGIKNVGTAAVEEISREKRENGPFASFTDFVERVDLRVVNRKVIETLIQSGLFDRLGQNRATLMGNLDTILEVAVKTKESRNIGQGSLFDNMGNEDFQEVEIQEMEEFPKEELLEMEKVNLGFFFSGHPLDDYRELIEANTNLDIRKAEYASEERSYQLAGLLRDVKEIITRRGRKMAFGRLENFEGSIELVLFSDGYDKYKDLFINDKMIGITGKVDKKKGDPKILVDTVGDPEKMPKVKHSVRRTREIHIRLRGRRYKPEGLIQLKNLCLERKGDCRLFLHVGTNGSSTIIAAGPELKVSSDKEFIESLYESPQVEKVWTR